ncbi:MAG TPA: MFS transporter [Lacunisphaera sp.]|jgi:predicted MFS family arabinose efflux permease
MKRLFLLALGAFAIGTEGYAIAGLLPTVAADLGVTVPVAGQLITAFSISFALGSPLLAVATGHLERKRLLLASILVFGLFNIVAALAHTYIMLLTARIGLALSAAAFMPAASAYAVAVSPVAQRGRALSIIYAGLTVATLVGVPLGVLIGERFGWRSIFLLAGGLSLATFIGLATLLVPSRSNGSATLGERIAVARRPEVLGALMVTVVFMTGVFAIYTYIAPFLKQTTGLAGSAVAVVLFIFGAGATIGNLAAGSLADRIGASRVVTTVLLGLVVVFSAISLAAETLAPHFAPWVILPAIGLWGLVGFAFPAAQQMRLVAMDPKLTPITLSLNASAGYLGVSLGALLGTAVVAHGAISGLGWVAAAGELTAFFVLLYTLRARATGATHSIETVPSALPVHSSATR